MRTSKTDSIMGKSDALPISSAVSSKSLPRNTNQTVTPVTATRIAIFISHFFKLFTESPALQKLFPPAKGRRRRRTPRVRTRGTSPHYMYIYPTFRKISRNACLQGHFCSAVECRVRAAGTVGGKAPGGCKAASDEDNLTTKQKCVLAQTFSRGRQYRRRTFGAWRRQP